MTFLRHVKHGLRESSFLLLLGAAVFITIALLSYNTADPAWTHTSGSKISNLGGVAGAWLSDIAFYFCGYFAYPIPIIIVYGAWRLVHEGEFLALDGEVVLFRTLGLVVAFSAGCGLASLFGDGGPGFSFGGGILGHLSSEGLITIFGRLGGGLFLLALFLAGTNLATGLSWVSVLDVVGKSMLLVLAKAGALLNALQRRVRPISQGETKAKPVVQANVGLASQLEPDLDPDAKSKRPRTLQAAPKSSVDIAATAMPTRTGVKRERVEPVIESLPFVLPVAVAKLIAIAPPLPTPVVAAPPQLLAGLKPAKPTRPASAKALAPSLPPFDLLDQIQSQETGFSAEILEQMSRQVEKLLADFGVKVIVVAVEPGPVITRFELDPAPGVKVSQITNLAKDLARGLSVVSVRVVEVIPGKPFIGLEIPNQQRSIVYLNEVLDSPPYRNLSSPLTLVLGKDIGGKPVVADLAKMPHLLVAGTTGSGKSVALNTMLLSILFKATPEQVRLIMIDPKMLELSVYEDIPHLLTPVVTDMKEAANALRWCVGEMERRYRLMATLKVRNITGFNKQVNAAIKAGNPIPDPLFKPEPSLEIGAVPEIPSLVPLPLIVIVIDELADMMMIVGKKVEELIARLAQKARASGIHLILATQRPSVDVITGLIKANVPTRIAFQVSSKVDSRTILDQMGAENLLGHGDMLYLPPGTAYPQRVHGAFVDDHEVNKVAEFLKQTAEPDYLEDILEGVMDGGGDNVLPFMALDGAGSGASEADPLYDQAVRIVTETRKASISGVQRRLKIGYNRAARMIEEMESAGIVSAVENNGSREVLAPPPPQD